jgi:hypothetical protein
MPKLQRIDGKVKHYAYTPEGKRQYERDKAAMKMSPTAKIDVKKSKSKPMHKMPNGSMMAGKSHPKSKKRNGIY